MAVLMLVLGACANTQQARPELSRTSVTSHTEPLTFDDAIAEAIAWVVQNSELEYHGEQLPVVVYRREWSGPGLTSPARFVFSSTPENVITKQELWLPHDFTLGLEDLSKLRHEIGHYLQVLAGLHLTWSCLELETQAYELQKWWLASNGYPWQYDRAVLERGARECEARRARRNEKIAKIMAANH